MKTTDSEPKLRDEPHTAQAEKTAPDWEALKLALNNAVWMHAPASTTLGQAEEASCRAISHLAECYNKASAVHETR